MDRGQAFTFLKAIDVRDATEILRNYVLALDGQPLIVLDGDTPLAALVPVTGTDLESLSLSTDPDFLDLIERSRRQLRESGGISTEELRRRLGLA